MRTEKECTKCGEIKALALYARCSRVKDGRKSQCKDCSNALNLKYAAANRDAQKAYRVENAEKLRAYDKAKYRENSDAIKERVRKYSKTAAGRLTASKSSLAQRKLHPEKYKARYTINNAIRLGHVKRGPCESCGEQLDIHAHHDDYSRPLDVRWLCREHHNDWHRINTREGNH